MSRLRFAALLALVLASGQANGQTIRIDGSAERSVLADTVDLVLALSTDLDSFSSARAAVEGLMERIRAQAHPLCTGGEARLHIEVAAGQPLSWSTRPKRLSHRILLRCDTGAAPPQVVAAALLDSLLALDPGLTVERVSAAVSAGRDDEIRTALLREAVASALRRAEAAASAAGSRVLRMASVEALPQAAWFAQRGRALPFRPGAIRTPGSPVLVEASPGFSGQEVFSPTVHYSAHVVAQFELAHR